MGQIIGSAAKPKRCNLSKLSQLGTPAAGEHILVSSDNSMNAAGQGNFDRYIIGDGRTAAAALELKYLDDSTHPYIVEEVNKAVADIQPIEITGDVTNAPDEEDLTSENQGGTDVLKFKDKAYNAALYSGLGRVYLRKNIVTLEGTGKNVLTQAMVNTANTIYHIQYDYDLNGQTITLPAGCVLEFDGGSISEGAIQLNEGCSVVNGKFVECTININDKDCSIINTSIVNTTKACIVINNIVDNNHPKDNLRIEGCALKTSYDGGGSVQGCAIRWHINNSDLISKNISIINNRIEYTCMGFELAQSGGRKGRECLENAVFADNIFVHLPSENTAKYFAISLPDNLSDSVYCNKNVVISNNVINGNGIGRAFEVAGEKFVITGNIIFNASSSTSSLLASGFRTYTDESQETVYMKALRDSIISNNHFRTIYLQSAENVTVENNIIDTVLSLGGDATKYYVEDIRVISNTINYDCVVDRDSGHIDYPFRITNAKNVAIRSNMFATNWSNGIIWTKENSTVPLSNIVVSDNYVSLRGKWPYFITQDVIASKNNFVEFDTFTELIDYKYGVSKFGNSVPIRFSNKGDVFFNKSIGGRPTYSNGDAWIDGNGHSAAPIKGTTASRPKGVGASVGVLDPSRDIGFQYFDTSISPARPIYVSAIANDGTVTWVDATGTAV